MKLKIVLIIILTITIGIWGFMNYVNKPVDDYSEQKPHATFTFDGIMAKLESDTASMNALNGKLIEIEANVKSLSGEKKSLTLELGNGATLSSITCQADGRYLAQFENLNTGDPITLKGILSGYTLDPDQLFGHTIEMKYCTRVK